MNQEERQQQLFDIASIVLNEPLIAKGYAFEWIQIRNSLMSDDIQKLQKDFYHVFFNGHGMVIGN